MDTVCMVLLDIEKYEGHQMAPTLREKVSHCQVWNSNNTIWISILNTILFNTAVPCTGSRVCWLSWQWGPAVRVNSEVVRGEYPDNSSKTFLACRWVHKISGIIKIIKMSDLILAMFINSFSSSLILRDYIVLPYRQHWCGAGIVARDTIWSSGRKWIYFIAISALSSYHVMSSSKKSTPSILCQTSPWSEPLPIRQTHLLRISQAWRILFWVPVLVETLLR